MSLQTNKKAISPMIAYILLISITIAISTIVYIWITTYVPKDAPECSDGISISVKNAVYNCADKTLELTIKNNGRFSLHGYFIYGSDDEDKEIATDAISKYAGSEGMSGVVAYGPGNKMIPEAEKEANFDLNPATEFTGNLVFVELIPVRYQTYNNKQFPVSCGEARIRYDLTCT